jgi:hypothetical protein
MGAWQNEDDIKAELRTLTAELRQLREELRSMVSPKKQSPGRALLPRQWSASSLQPGARVVAEAADTNREHPPKRQKK